MVKEKKITIKHFLNKELKPVSTKDKEKRFSLYSKVIYDRKNTRFPNPFTFAAHGLTKEEFIEIFDNQKTPYFKEVNDFDKNLNRIIRFEHKVLGDDFLLAGIGTRYIKYFQPLIYFMEKAISLKLKAYVSEIPNLELSQPEKESIDTALDSFFTIGFTLCEKIIPNFKANIPSKLEREITALLQLETASINPIQPDFLRLIDWLNPKVRKEYQYHILNYSDSKEPESYTEDVISQKFLPNPVLAGNYVSLIDRMIVEYLV